MRVRQGQLTLGEALDSIVSRLDGCDSAAVVGMDGMAIEQRSRSQSLNLELVAAEHTSLLKAALAARRETDSGDPTELILLTHRHQFIIRLLARDYFLLLVLRPDASLGRARYEAHRAGLLLEDELR